MKGVVPVDVEIFRRLASRRYSNLQRLLSVVLQSVVFGAAGPLVLCLIAPYLDRAMGFSSFRGGMIALVTGVVFAVEGFVFAAWAVLTQYRIGLGTPSPLMPTRRLVVEGPFAFCRNPMTFGAFFYYLGVSLLAGSPAAVIVTVFLFSMLLLYIKRVEEKELELRFGEDYRAYRERTSFIIPRRPGSPAMK